jgi:centrosomal protein CEP104
VDQLPDVDKTPWWDKSEVKVLPKKARKKQPKEEDEGPILSFKNPFAFNEGDVDLELYVNPLLA